MQPAAANSWRKPAFAALILAYFLYFNLDALHTNFAADDMMNMASYWRLKPLRMILHPFMPWRGDYRPVAAFYYLPLLQTFGLNPLPFHAVMTAILSANVYLTYRFARLAGCPGLPAALAALLVAYHAGLSVVYYSTAFIYDVLCFTFYLAALICYMKVRAQQRCLRPRETALVLLLYLFALGSKEMALTLPLILLVYEFTHHPIPRKLADALPWLRGPGRVILYAALLNVVYLYGKAYGPDPMMQSDAYRPHLSLQRIFAFQKAAMNDLFLAPDAFDWRGVVAVWLITAYLAFRRRNPALRLAWAFLMLTPLPLALLEGRSGGCLYIPLAGWAVFVSLLLTAVAGTAARFLAAEPLFRHARFPGLLAAILCAALFLWARQNHLHKRAVVQHAMDDVGRLTTDTLRKMRALNPHVKSGSHVAFLHDPFPEWDMLFIAELWFRDKSLQFHLVNKTPLPPEELAKMTVFEFQDDRLVQLTTAGPPRP